jgi:hypothetical protein
MTIKSFYPTILPSLNLDFANSKTLDPRITFTRASTATYIGADGLIKTAASGAPRFDHNPATGESLGLLVEEARTNSLLYSGNIITVADGTVRPIASVSTFTPNADIAPDGTMSAYLIDPSNSFDGVRVQGNIFPVVSGQSYTASMWVKKVPGITYQNLSIVVNGWASPDVVSVNSLINSSSGWIRVSATFTSNITASREIHFIRQQSGSAVSSQPLYVWGPQLEAGAFPTSYIPTTTATVTRAADVASITGSNFSSWYNQSEGTLFQNCISRAPNGGPGGNDAGVGAYLSGSPDIQIGFARSVNDTNVSVSVYSNSVNSASFYFGAQWAQNTVSKAIVAYKLNDFAASANGLTVQTDTSGVVPIPTQLDIGQMTTAAYNRIGAGTFSRITYYPVRLSNAQLQALTR